MKLASLFFTASESIFEINLKYTAKNRKKQAFGTLFFSSEKLS